LAIYSRIILDFVKRRDYLPILRQILILCILPRLP